MTELRHWADQLLTMLDQGMMKITGLRIIIKECVRKSFLPTSQDWMIVNHVPKSNLPEDRWARDGLALAFLRELIGYFVAFVDRRIFPPFERWLAKLAGDSSANHMIRWCEWCNLNSLVKSRPFEGRNGLLFEKSYRRMKNNTFKARQNLYMRWRKVDDFHWKSSTLKGVYIHIHIHINV